MLQSSHRTANHSVSFLDHYFTILWLCDLNYKEPLFANHLDLLNYFMDAVIKIIRKPFSTTML